METLTASLPTEYRLIKNFGAYTTYSSIQLNKKGLIQSLVERKRNELDEAYDSFLSAAPREATIIFGMQISTAIASAQNGTFMYVTITGTAAVHEVISNR